MCIYIYSLVVLCTYIVSYTYIHTHIHTRIHDMIWHNITQHCIASHSIPLIYILDIHIRYLILHIMIKYWIWHIAHNMLHTTYYIHIYSIWHIYIHICTHCTAQRSEGRSRRPGGPGQQTQHRCNDWDNESPQFQGIGESLVQTSLSFLDSEYLRIIVSWRCTDWDRGTLGVKVKRPPQSVVDLVVDLEFSTDIYWIGASSLVRLWPGWPGWP